MPSCFQPAPGASPPAGRAIAVADAAQASSAPASGSGWNGGSTNALAASATLPSA
jgi:hypothetical protein